MTKPSRVKVKKAAMHGPDRRPRRKGPQAAKPATLIGVIADSAPPQIIASAVRHAE